MYHLYTMHNRRVCEIKYKVKHIYSNAPVGRIPADSEYCSVCLPTVKKERTKAVELIREFLGGLNSMSTDNTELREQILTEFKQVHKLAPADYTENCTNVVMQLIARHTDEAVLMARLKRIDSQMKYLQGSGSVIQLSDLSMERMAVESKLAQLKPTKTPEDKEGENE